MIKDKRMKYLSSEDGFDYYVFSPTLFRQYYNKTEEWTAHRTFLTHKIHMLLFFLLGGYKILYMMDKENIASYLVYSRCGGLKIKGSTKKDILTIFVTTHPDYRGKGLAKKIGKKMSDGIGLEYNKAYKSILDTNVASIKVALADGYRLECKIKKSKILRTISSCDNSDWGLYSK